MGGDSGVPKVRGPVRSLVFVATALAAFALLASPAAALTLLGPGAAGKDGKAVRFTARGSNGYKVAVYAPVGPRSPVTITVESFKGAAQYVATGAVTTSGVRASFGRFGRISMRFQPAGKTLRGHLLDPDGKECPGKAAAQIGTFVGSFRFSGEDGYTSVDVHKVAGGVGAPTAPIDKREKMSFGCHLEQHLAEPSLPTALPLAPGETPAAGGLTLGAIEPTATGAVLLVAGPVLVDGKPQNPLTTAVIALVQEQVEGVRIGRLVLGGGKSAEVLPDTGSSTSATLTPGAPFSGSATYAAGTLTGDLSVPMPGAGTVELDGPSFQAELLRPQT